MSDDFLFTSAAFDEVLCGEGARWVRIGGELTRLRYHVADAIDLRATERQKAGRPDKASLLRHISGKLRAGSHPSKRTALKAASDLEVVRAALCRRSEGRA